MKKLKGSKNVKIRVLEKKEGNTVFFLLLFTFLFGEKKKPSINYKR